MQYAGPEVTFPDDGGNVVPAAYQRAVQRVDAEVGRLLEALHTRYLDRDAIVVLARIELVGERQRRAARPENPEPSALAHAAGLRTGFLARVPKGRLGEPSDLAGPLLFLASRASDFYTGHVLYADGGYTAG